MAKNEKYFDALLAQEFGKNGKGFRSIFKTVDVKDQNGNLIAHIHDEDELKKFSKTHQNNIDTYEYQIDTRSDQYNKMTDGWRRLSNFIKKASGRSTNPTIVPAGSIKEKYGSDYRYQSNKKKNYAEVRKAAQTKILQEINDKNDKILTYAAQEPKEIVETAKIADPNQYYDLLKKNELSLDDDKQIKDKAMLIIKEARGRKVSLSNSGKKNKWLSSVVWRLSKKTPYYTEAVGVKGRDGVEIIDSKLDTKHHGYDSISKAREKAFADEYKKKLGNKDSSTRKFIQRFKNKNPHLHSVDEAIKFLKTEEGQRIANEQLWDEARRGKDGPIKSDDTAQRIQSNLGIAGPKIETTVKDKPQAALDKTAQVKAAGNAVLGYSTYNKAGAFIHHVMNNDPEAVKALRDGDKDAIRNHAPSSVSYDEMRQFYGNKQPKKSHVAKLVESGITVTDLPSDIQDYVDKKTAGESSSSRSSSSLFGRSSRRSSSRSSSNSTSRKSSTSDGSDLIGGKTIKWIGGKPHVVNERGKIGTWMHDKKTKIPGLRSGDEKQKKQKEKERKKIRAAEERYKELKDDKSLQYMSDEELRYLAKDANAVEKWRMKQKAKKMYMDPGYRAKVAAKTEQKKGVYEAKYLQAKKESKRRARAATSPWWKAWYGLSHNLWVLLGVLIAISVLFLPVGLFYVVGWSLAVGATGLIQFIIWVFLELWYMIAQALVSLIGMVGQGIMAAINFAGQAVTNALGFEYNAMEWTFVQDMVIPDLPGLFGSGHTWGDINLIPPNFMKLDSFMPTTFDTDAIIAKFIPVISGFFNWIYAPIAQRYTDWIATADWWYVGLVIGVPAVLAIIGLVAAVFFVRRRLY